MSERFIQLGPGDEVDLAAGRCCPTCRHDLTTHNVKVWNAGYSIGMRHAEAPPSEASLLKDRSTEGGAEGNGSSRAALREARARRPLNCRLGLHADLTSGIGANSKVVCRRCGRRRWSL